MSPHIYWEPCINPTEPFISVSFYKILGISYLLTPCPGTFFVTIHKNVLPGEFHVQRNLMGYSPWGHKESDMTERLTPSQECHQLWSWGVESPPFPEAIVLETASIWHTDPVPFAWTSYLSWEECFFTPVIKHCSDSRHEFLVSDTVLLDLTAPCIL